MQGFGYSSEVICANLVGVNIPKALKTLISQYAADFPIVFAMRGKKSSHMLFYLLEKQYIRIENDATSYSKNYKFHSYDMSSGTIFFEKKNSRHHVRISQQVHISNRGKCFLIEDSICFLNVQPLSHCYTSTEYAINCKLSQTTSLQLEFVWGCGRPMTYFIEPNGYNLLDWEFPPEIISYADGYIARVYYLNQQLLLITQDAMYLAKCEPSKTTKMQRKQWKKMILLPPTT